MESEKRGIIGIMNLGNTCYMNAAIQVLRHFPEFSLLCTQGTLEQACADKNTNHYKIVRGFTDLVQSIWSGTSPGYVLPKGFLEDMRSAVTGTVYEDFIRRTPQDAHEYIIWLLDQLYMASARPLILPFGDGNKADEAWSATFSKSWSPLVDLFFGQSRMQYTCSVCKTIHSRYETFNSLKVQPIPGHTLADCISDEFEIVETIDAYACEVCEKSGGARASAEKRVRIMRMPKLIILTVKRYSPTGQRINTPIVHENCEMKFDNIFADESSHYSRKSWYRTIGTVDHYGGSMGGGHYVAQCWSPVWKSWTRYDDENSEPLEQAAYGAHTYMVFMRAVGQ